MRFKEPKVNEGVRQKLYRAIYEGTQIKGLYKNRGENIPKKRHIHPLGIVIKGSMHYLICMMEEDPVHPRFLPIQRFVEVEILDENVTAFDKVVNDCLALCCPQIYRQRLFISRHNRPPE